MRASMAWASSTGESFRSRSRRASFSMLSVVTAAALTTRLRVCEG